MRYPLRISAEPLIFIVEDDPELAGMVAGYLREHGFQTETEPRGDRAGGRILAARPAAVVLDVMLPGKDGLTVCRELRGAYRGAIVMLTALGAEVDEVTGVGRAGGRADRGAPPRPRRSRRGRQARPRAPRGAPRAARSIGALAVRRGEARLDRGEIVRRGRVFDAVYLAPIAGTDRVLEVGPLALVPPFARGRGILLLLLLVAGSRSACSRRSAAASSPRARR